MSDREQFDHSVGADRFKVVRGAYWWHVLIGDSPTRHGKFHTQSGAEEMAALLLREFRNGAFVQHKAEPEPERNREWHDGLLEGRLRERQYWLAQPKPEPVREHEAWCASLTQLLLSHPPKPAPCNCKTKLSEPVPEMCGSPDGYWVEQQYLYLRSDRESFTIPLYTAAPPVRRPLTDEEIHDCFQQRHMSKVVQRRMITRAIERAHGITGGNDE